MYFKRVVVDKVLLLAVLIPSIANVTSLMLVSAMGIELIVAIKALPTESALRMTLEPALIDRAWIIISKLLVLAQFADGEKFVLVGKHFLIPCAEITHDLVVHTLDMPMQVWPSQTGDITVLVWTIVPKQ